MKWYIIIFALTVSLYVATPATAQDFSVNDTSRNVIYRHESKYGLSVSTQGLGAKFAWGKNIDAFVRRSLCVELNTFKALKEQRVYNLFNIEGKSYIFGKLNYVINLRIDRLIERQLNRKPYWRGVEVRWFYQYGLDLGFAKPYYLLVYDAQNDQLIEAIYDPATISDESIIGRAAFLKGIDETKLHPGIHLAGGLNFDYSIYRTTIKELSLGIHLDIYPYPVQILALNPPNYFFLTLSLGLNVGSRK